MKKFILNADDLAKSENHNRAIADGYKYGILKSTSIMANMPFYNDALWNVVRPNPNLGVGVHLNLIEGKALNPELFMLCDEKGNFNNSYLKLIINSTSKKFLSQIEKEFRSQIEKCISDFKPAHIDSHVHTHAIPSIFELVCKLAVEYGIKQVRTQNEKFYFINDKKYDKKTYNINLIKVLLLKYFTLINKKTIKKYNLKTNDYILGVSYTSMMDSTTVLEGLKKFKNEDITVEALIHPCLYEDTEIIDNHLEEYLITKDEMLKDLIEKNLDFKIVNYLE